jgi:putative glutamine amidotransferase
MTRPVIGLTTYLEPVTWGAWSTPAAVLHTWYLDYLREAGADVVLLPPVTPADVVDRLDGLALTGGADIDARLYAATPDATADVPRESRDASELGLYRAARERGLPVLGICRGVQIMAVAHGGTLVQNLPDVSGTSVHREQPGQFVTHSATFVPGSLAARIFGTEPVTVNSSHHQCVDLPGDLAVTGRSEDGTVEVCEDGAADFCLGVQWHAEHPDRRVVDLPLAQAFVAAATQRRAHLTSG